MIVGPLVAERPTASGRRRHPPLLLPYGWPIYALCYGYPLWWVLGLAEFIWPILGFIMLVSLTMRRDTIRVPKGFGAYVLFLLCPLLHLLMHGWHGSGHDGHGASQDRSSQGEA